MNSTILQSTLLGFFCIAYCQAADAQQTSNPQPAQDADQKPVKELILPGEAFLFDDHPAFMIHGELDTVVPLRENSAAYAQAYGDAGQGDAVRVIVAEGLGHNYWEGFFRCQPLIGFVIERARAGAAETSAENPEKSPEKKK